jgi:hypothetical protein
MPRPSPTHTLAAAQLAADQKTEQADLALATQADNQHSTTVESVYDVAFNPAGTPWPGHRPTI